MDRMQAICTLLQTDNHTNTSSFNFTGRVLFVMPNQQRQSTEGRGLRTSAVGRSGMPDYDSPTPKVSLLMEDLGPHLMHVSCVPSCLGSASTSNTSFLRPTRVHISNGTLVCSVFFVWLVVVTNTQTDKPCHSCSNCACDMA